MANMSLGGHTFLSNPSKMTVLLKKKYAVEEVTYSSVAFYDWGRSWAGMPVTLNWDFMEATDFDTIEALQDIAGDLVFDPQDGKGKTFDVWFKFFDGEYHLDPRSASGVFRTNVEMKLVIKEQS
jgi:hypothetical protein